MKCSYCHHQGSLCDSDFVSYCDLFNDTELLLYSGVEEFDSSLLWVNDLLDREGTE